MSVLNRWTKDEIEYLRDNYKKLSLKELSVKLDRNTDAIKCKASSLKISVQPRFWTTEEDNYIRENYGKFPAKDIAEKLNRQYHAVRTRASDLNVPIYYPENKSVKSKISHIENIEVLNTTRWTKEEDNFLIENYHKFSAKELSEKLSRGYDATKKRAKTLKITNKPSDVWTDAEIEILKNEYGKISYEELLKKYNWNRTEVSIEHKVNKLGLTKGWKERKRANKKIKQKIITQREIYFALTNHEFFKEPNILNSFVAGLISADGCISDGNELQIPLKSTDKEYLTEVCKLFSKRNLSINLHISELPFGYGLYTNEMCSFRATSKQICEDLINNFNIVPRKSLILEPPENLSLENSLAFIRGNLDGDGSIISIMQTQKQNNVIYTYPSFSLKFLGTLKFLLWIKQIFSNYVIFDSLNIYKDPGKNIYEFRFSGQKAITIYNILNQIHVPIMKRKWNNTKLQQIEGLIGTFDFEWDN